MSNLSDYVSSGGGGSEVSNLVVSNWTIRTSAADNSWQSVAWSPELGVFCAVAYSGAGDRAMTSLYLKEGA